MSDRDVLVLLDLTTGEGLTREDEERLTLARELGEPVAVVPGIVTEAGCARLRRLGVARAVEIPLAEGLEPAPSVSHGLVELMGRRDAVAAVLAPNSGFGVEVAARVAVRTGSGLIGNAVDVRERANGVVMTQLVFGGAYKVESSTTTGTPVLTVRPGVCAVREYGPEDVVVSPLGKAYGARRPAPRMTVAGQ